MLSFCTTECCLGKQSFQGRVLVCGKTALRGYLKYPGEEEYSPSKDSALESNPSKEALHKAIDIDLSESALEGSPSKEAVDQ